MEQKRLEQYAKLAVEMGANVQKGQTLILNTSIEAIDFTRACVKAAYEAGAKEVIVNYEDERIAAMHYTYQSEETLSHVRNWQVESKLDYLKEGACLLKIHCGIPGVMKDVGPAKSAKAMQARGAAMKEVNAYTSKNKVQWSIVAVPNKEWAKQVFPHLKEEEALEALWDAILKAVHVDNDDPVAVWEKHNATLAKRVEKLNALRFEKLHFTSQSSGTDLWVELVKDHIWAGGCEVSEAGIVFNPNMPTEEVFTMPYRLGVNGVVYASKPLDHNGKLIEDFYFRFEKGRVVDCGAKKEEAALKLLVDFDEGSHYIGEVALVPYASPISMSNLLFLNTLFDENASCHLALGRAYAMNVAGGLTMSEEELKKAGANDSNTHVDFMFGTADMCITGVLEDGKEVAVFADGNFVL